MTFTLLNLGLLAGLAGIAIPPIVHLLNRKRFDVVPWGAMQFLLVSERTRRKIFLEELLLMLVRMGAIGLLVLALCAPEAKSEWFRYFRPRLSRDAVILLDGSYSMSYRQNSSSLHDNARDWAARYLDARDPQDGVAIVHVRQRPVPLIGELSRDRDAQQAALQTCPGPRGGADWPSAIQTALQLLQSSKQSQRDIVILTDGQRRGWADETSILQWELLAPQLKGTSAQLWWLNFGSQRPDDPANGSLLPLRCSRAVAAAGQRVTFRGTYQRLGAGDLPRPSKLSLFVDDQPAGDVPLPPAPAEKGQLNFRFQHRFAAAGSHKVTLRSPPDVLPGDDVQEFALEVLPTMPVLVIEGDANTSARNRGSDFLRDALMPRRDPAPSTVTRVVAAGDFTPNLLAAESPELPRAVILSNVARLNAVQLAALSGYVARGGGLLIAPGNRADANFYNDELFRAGQGLLPAALDKVDGEPTARGLSPQTANFFHPALELFRESAVGGLSDARFPQRWAIVPPPAGSSATTIGNFVGGAPMFVEKPFGSGRVILCAVPLDDSWKTNLVTLPAYAPLIHELAYYLASARAGDANLQPGQPIRYPLPANGPRDWLVQPPDGPALPVTATKGWVTFADTREPGSYKLSSPSTGVTRWYVVQSDPRESDLSPLRSEDRDRLAPFLPTLNYPDALPDPSDDLRTAGQEVELWWLGMVGVIALMLFELFLTRRRALGIGE